MSNPILEKIKSILANPSSMNMEKLKGFVEETTEYFRNLQMRATATKPEEREKAMQEALELKAGLEEQMGELSKVTGLSPEQMMSLAGNAEHLNPSERKILEEAQKKLTGLKKESKIHSFVG